MIGRLLRGIVLLLLACALTGCGGYSPSTVSMAPTSVSPSPAPAPSPPVPQPPAPALPAPGYSPGYTLTAVSLSGIVIEMTATGDRPIKDVSVYCDACGAVGHTWSYTDSSGRYSFSGDLGQRGGVWLPAGAKIPLLVKKEGYAVVGAETTFADGTGSRNVIVNGDTRFDILLVRR